MGEYVLAGLSLVLSLFILYALDFIQFRIDFRFQHRDYKITFKDKYPSGAIQQQVESLNLQVTNSKVLRSGEQVILEVLISGKGKQLELFNDWLLDQNIVQSFEW